MTSGCSKLYEQASALMEAYSHRASLYNIDYIDFSLEMRTK